MSILDDETPDVQGDRSPSANRSREGPPPERRIPYIFNRPVPRRVDELVDAGVIAQADRDVLRVMLDPPSIRADSCWCTKRVITKTSTSVVLRVEDVITAQQHATTSDTARETRGLGLARFGWRSSSRVIMEGAS